MSEQKVREPPTLYKTCLSRIAYFSRTHRTSHIRELPDTVLSDVYYQMVVCKELCVLGCEMSDLAVLSRLLRLPPASHHLLSCFQAVMEHGTDAAGALSDAYERRCESSHHHDPQLLIQLGLQLGGFLSEAGWWRAAERVLTACRDVCAERARAMQSVGAPHAAYAAHHTLTLECLHRLLNAQSAYCSFPGAADTYSEALRLLGAEDAADEGAGDAAAACRARHSEGDARLARGRHSLVARLYKEFSALTFVRCDYSAAYRWSVRAMQLLRPDSPTTLVVEVLRACGKACVLKRKFARAGLLMRQAVAVAREAFGPAHPRYAFALLDYGFYLLNIDSILHSVSVYEEALEVVRGVFGSRSLHVATAHEDLAYALYVLEYSSGRFYKAKEHVERAIHIIEGLVPSEHLLLASAKRVKALILEEIALDSLPGNQMNDRKLLEESEALHKAALELSRLAFGENNVQTAKHYGNLGRLYQSMNKFQEAERMHLKAIAIKEELLGADDYEVGLSVGHLASLYNYHMSMYRAAEQLYYRSIAISLKLFGERYSGLEYDYRGLVHVFTQQKKHDQAELYNRMLSHWHDLREESRGERDGGGGSARAGGEDTLPLHTLLQHFYTLDTH